MKNLHYQQAKSHILPFADLYSSWGLADHATASDAKSHGSIGIQPIDSQTAQELAAKFSHFWKAQALNYKLSAAGLVDYFQGPNQPLLKAYLLRFTRADGVNSEIGGEHITLLIEQQKLYLLGLVKMLHKETKRLCTSHQNALSTAVNFLSQEASDLTSNLISPDFPSSFKADDCSRVEFSTQVDNGKIDPGYKISDRLSLLWIADHPESFYTKASATKLTDLHGMKVKMIINDHSSRYVWCIVDPENQIQVFEKNIHWHHGDGTDKDPFRRTTQMWLHDGWLMAHKISLPSISA